MIGPLMVRIFLCAISSISNFLFFLKRMKKIYGIGVALCLMFNVNGQEAISFEGVVLAPESYNNGSSGSGGFIENGIAFSNTYTTSAWGDYWGGFAVSNTSDVTTAGYGNQYSAFTGVASDSSNYAVGTSSGVISFTGMGVYLQSVNITNTTYAALSMRDGDSFGKQFGSNLDANGVDDGTNGEDFFYLTIYAENASHEVFDSVQVYLADYRFSDNNQDYILDSWETVDLSVITEPVYFLSFSFTSSDVGQWGMNTPAFFAMDELLVDKSVAVNNTELSSLEVYPNPFQDELRVSEGTGEITILDLTGKIVLNEIFVAQQAIQTSSLKSGSYFVKVSTETGTITRQFIKQ
jgi:hypothetical protein